MDRHFGVDDTLAGTHPLNPAGNLLKISKIGGRGNDMRLPIVPLWPAESSCWLELQNDTMYNKFLKAGKLSLTLPTYMSQLPAHDEDGREIPGSDNESTLTKRIHNLTHSTLFYMKMVQ